MSGRLKVVRTARGVWVGWPGGAKFFGAERRDAAGGIDDSAEVRAPMTGRVVQVAVAPGAPVRGGDLLVILQAMKMEYRLVSPRDGSVESLGCKEGDRVDLGKVLVTLAP